VFHTLDPSSIPKEKGKGKGKGKKYREIYLGVLGEGSIRGLTLMGDGVLGLMLPSVSKVQVNSDCEDDPEMCPNRTGQGIRFTTLTRRHHHCLLLPDDSHQARYAVSKVIRLFPQSCGLGDD
jgi:hypothetical protein